MAQVAPPFERYFADFTAFEHGGWANSTSWLRPLRARAMKRFGDVGMPTARRGNERWKYTNVGPIARAEFGLTMDGARSVLIDDVLPKTAPWDDLWTTIVFVDGRYVSGLSNLPETGDGPVITSLANASTDHRSVIQKHLASQAPVEDDDGFATLNTAFVGDGAFVQVPAGLDVEVPIHLLFVTGSSLQPTVSYPRVLVHADRLSRATVIESYVSLSEEQYFTNTVAELIISEGARLDHYRVMIESPKAFHIGTTRVRQSHDSVFDSLSVSYGPAIGRNDLHVLLDAPGAECNLNGLYMTNGQSHLDNHINVTHAKPHTTSRQFYKGILTDKSRAVFSGVVLVERDAQHAYATQRDMNLLLSHGAEIDTKPSLLIYADDVQCFHGAAAGEMDENALFYMLSRGLDHETAEKMLVHSFTTEIIEKVQPQPLRSYLDGLVTSLLPQFRYENST